MALALDLVDYLAFFEVEPTPITPGTDWYYGSRFVSIRGPEKIIATVAPDDGEFSFKWWHEGRLHADIKLAGVVEWRIENEEGLERLLLKFIEPKIPYFILQLKPHICVFWVMSWA